MTSRLAVMLLLCALGPSCNCFVPVSDDDAGAGGGTGGGSGGGGGGGCSTASDCQAAAPSVHLCESGSSPGFSCIDRHCIFECSTGRACTFDAGSKCLDCTVPSATVCMTTSCGTSVRTATAAGATNNCQLPFNMISFRPTNGCQYVAELPDGGVAGTFTMLTAEGVWQVPGMGTCIAHDANPGGQVPRWVVSCEGCQFSLLGFF